MHSNKISPKFSPDFILNETSRCVSCGLCLPHCPTYNLLKSEADSPRGRIALMSGVVRGQIPMNARFIQHMDRCLTCRACESVCPNNVAYGQLIDETRAMIITSESDLKTSLNVSKKTKFRALLENELIAKPTRFDQLRFLFKLFIKSGLQQWLQKSNLFGKTKFSQLVAQLPYINFPDSIDNKVWKNIYPAHGTVRGEVGLFLGCVARLTDFVTLHSAIFVLNRLGYTVNVPSNQTCCGALHQHSGDATMAEKLAQQNKMAFNTFNNQTVISTASGCGSQLVDCDQEQKTLSSITDISRFLMSVEGWEEIKILPLTERVVVHEPCSLRNVLHDQAYPYALMARIPDLQVVPLARNSQCCGAAGTYFIDQPDLAKQLLDDKVSAAVDSGARYLVTSNIGCSLHIASGLREIGVDLEVLHPVTLLARQMGIQY